MRLLIVFKSMAHIKSAMKSYKLHDTDEGDRLLDCITKIDVKTSTNAKRSLHVLFVHRDASGLSEIYRRVLPRFWEVAGLAIYSMSDLTYGLEPYKHDASMMTKLDLIPADIEAVLSRRVGKLPFYTGRMGMKVQKRDEPAVNRLREYVANFAEALQVERTHRFSAMPDLDMRKVVNAIWDVFHINLPHDVEESLFFSFAEFQPSLTDVVRWLVQQGPLIRLFENDGAKLQEEFAQAIYLSHGHTVPSQFKSRGLRASLVIGNGNLKVGKLVQFLDDIEERLGVRLHRNSIDDRTTNLMPVCRWFERLQESCYFSLEPWCLEPIALEHAQIFLHQDKYYLVKGTNIEFFPVRNVSLDRDRLGKSPETMFVEGNCTYQPCATKQEAELELARHYAKQLENVV